MAHAASVPQRARQLADRLVHALLPLIEERLAHKFAALEQRIEERLHAGEQRLGNRFGAFSRKTVRQDSCGSRLIAPPESRAG